MGFRYEPGTLRAAAKDMDELRLWVKEAREYASEHLDINTAFDEGFLNTFMFTHSSVESTTNDYLRDLQTLVDDVAEAFRTTDDTYRTVDRDRARVLDHIAGALPEGELEASKAETGEIPDQYWLITNWTDPTKHLLDPEVDPDIGGSSWWDLLSPSAFINSAVLQVTKFGATIGLIDHEVNVIEELCKPLSGDWNAYKRAGNALNHLGDFLYDVRTDFRGTANTLELPWKGNASDHARDFLYDAAADLSTASKELKEAGQNYEESAEAAKDFAKLLGIAVEVCTDTAAAAAIAAGAAGTAAASGFGLPIALIAGGYALSKVKKVVDAVRDALNAYKDLSDVVESSDGFLRGLGVVSGYLPLPDLAGGRDVPVVTP